MLLKNLFNWFLGFFKSKKEQNLDLYNISIVPEVPVQLEDKVLYIEGNDKTDDYWYALLKCPCGCNENIRLNLMNDAEPSWEVIKNKSDFSISPSIWRIKNCKSHFWLRNREIHWVK